MYAVMGITGNVGGAVARTLLAKGEKVRGIARNPEKAAEWQKQGAELFKADYDDVDALTAAFTGVAGVFVMVPPNFAPAPGFAETKAERMSAIGRMACSISHDMRHSLTAIYANAEFLERRDLCASARADLLLEIQEAVLAMTDRIESLPQFGSSGRKSPLVRARVPLVVEKAVAAVKFHPDGAERVDQSRQVPAGGSGYRCEESGKCRI
jgi:signal transduction histidine kinase